MSNLFNWQVLVAIVAAVGFVILLVKVLKDKAKTVKSLLSILEHADELIEFFMPDKYEPVYKALITAIKRVTDGTVTGDEAITTAREVFDLTLKELKVSLTDEEKAFADKILVFAINMIDDKLDSAEVAVNTVCKAKNYNI